MLIVFISRNGESRIPYTLGIGVNALLVSFMVRLNSTKSAVFKCRFSIFLKDLFLFRLFNMTVNSFFKVFFTPKILISNVQLQWLWPLIKRSLF